MASIDKIYGTKEQYDRLIGFLEHHEEDYIKFTSHKWRSYPKGGDDSPILNTNTMEDLWLAINCKLELSFVLDRIKIMYNIREKADYRELVNYMWINAIDDIESSMCDELEMFELYKSEWLKRKADYKEYTDKLD